MSPLKIYISENPYAYDPLKYIWHVFALNKGITYSILDTKENVDIIVDETASADICISPDFYKKIAEGDTKHSSHFINSQAIVDTKNNPDHLSTAFYMLNCIQEHNSNDLDEIGRFKYSNSYQYRFKSIEENLVQRCFDELIKACPKLLPAVKEQPPKTKFYLSHDIDSINGALIQDGFASLKKGKPWVIFQLFINTILQKPEWLNMDKIMKIESEYDFRSTFFWLVNKGKVNNREVNSDYDINAPNIKTQFENIYKNDFFNGLHKSISSESFTDEINKLPGKNIIANRYHYLKFILPNAFYDIEKARLKMDASLGFAEAIGFRNNYGLPFKPYNFLGKKAFDFIEVPLNVMDGTFQRYMKLPVGKVADATISFFEKNKNNCIVSVLWHNTFFTDYKYEGYLAQYRKLLEYFYESKFDCVTPENIINDYKA